MVLLAVPLAAAVFYALTLPGLGKTGGPMAEQLHQCVGHMEREAQPQVLMLQHLRPEYIFNLPCFLCGHFFPLGNGMVIKLC